MQEFSSIHQAASATSEATIAIIGGGPGGLFTAWHLENRLGLTCKIIILEGSDRIGGKIVTGNIGGTGIYEAGVAEIYDYAHLGFDPLRRLIETDLGLSIQHIRGNGCVLRGKILSSLDDVSEKFSAQTRAAIEAFRKKCASMMSPLQFYQSARSFDNSHPWANISAEDVLKSEVKDEEARRYFRIMAHSDVAAEPHQTNGLNFLKNVLMDVPGYIDIYSIAGGNEGIVDQLSEQIDAEIHLNTQVTAVSALPEGGFHIETGYSQHAPTFEADYVVAALPLSAMAMIDWRPEAVQHALAKHMHYFDKPAHYLRITILFERPFWRQHLAEAWFMLDAFGGVCVYDEGVRHDLGSWGALGFLIAGEAALNMANLSDERIEDMCLNALPEEFGDLRSLVIDRRVHRWMASVNAIPGGMPVRSLAVNHNPAPKDAKGLFVVGDYLFDSTLNGVLDSADTAADMIMSDLLSRRRSKMKLTSVQEPSKQFASQVALDAAALAAAIQAVWKVGAGARILEIGDGNGVRVAGLRAQGFEVQGIEIESLLAAKDSEAVKLPFEDGAFDIVIEHCLERLPRQRANALAAEMSRVARRGVAVTSVTSDLPLELIEQYDLLRQTQTLSSRWELSELFLPAGFSFAMAERNHLDEAWAKVEADLGGPGRWYEDVEAFFYSFYNSPAAESEAVPA